MTIPTRRLFTWVDVDDQLAAIAEDGNWPAWLIEASAYWDSIELMVGEEVPNEDLKAWLTESLGPGSVESVEDEIVVRLEAFSEEYDRTLRVVQAVDSGYATGRLPLWQRRNAHADLGSPLDSPATELPVSVFAFHSYKGGVGRTTHALAAALGLADRGRVLVIDADIEAPGLSWMFRDAGRTTDFAFEDFLALLQSAPDNKFEAAIGLAKRFVPNQAIEEILFLPVRRDLLSMAPPRVTPSDLLVSGRSPYHLTDAIGALAVALGAKAVVIDLRAGASEFSSQVLLDPRITRVFVTSASAQSLEGTAVVLGEIAKLAPAAAEADPYPAVVVTQYRESTSVDQLSKMVAPLVESLEVARTSSASNSGLGIGNQEDSLITGAIEPVFSPFRESFLQLPSAWNDVSSLVREQGLIKLVEQLVTLPESDVSEVKDLAENGAAAAVELASARGKLADFARPLAFAESTKTQDFLITDALQELVVSHRTVLPAAVVAGSKGSGKTFTQLQMIYRETWKKYADATKVSDVSVDARITPVLTSRNLKPDAEQRVLELRDDAAGRQVEFSRIAFADAISEALLKEMSDRDWRHLWIWGLARSVGLDVEPDEAEAAMIEAAVGGARWVFVLDGLEDLLQNISSDEAQQQALRVLMTDCLDWVRSIRGQPFGMVVFVRRDLIRAALPQNSAQFLSRYRNYELLWDEDEAIRLAAWVTTQSGALGLADDKDIQRISGEELTAYMLPVWGDKMGTPKSREARSRTWFVAALSDFNGGIQARDIVLFLAEAAKGSKEDERWSDRLLIPAAMRAALLECSKEKIQAIGEETPKIKAIFAHLRQLEAEQRQVPFTRDSVDLSSEDVDLLEQNGVLFREENHYWIPEIFRHGLDFRASGRPRILSVANLVRKRNNFD